MRHRTTAPHLFTLGALLFGAGLILACSDRPSTSTRTAPTEGPVGRVTALVGEVSYSAGDSRERSPLALGDEVRAEWTLHTASGAEVTVKLHNGHLWTLGGDLSKRVSTAEALTLPAVREGALARVSDLGGRRGTDRTAAAGLHHERSVAKKAAPSAPQGLLDGEGSSPSAEPLLDETAHDRLGEAPKATPAKTQTAMASEDPAPAMRPPLQRPKDARGPTPAGMAAKDRQPLLQGFIDSRGRGGGIGGAGPGAGGGARRPHLERSEDMQPRPVQPPPPPDGVKSSSRPSPPPPEEGKAEKDGEAALPQRPLPAEISKVLLPRLSSIQGILRQHGVTGQVKLILTVDGPSGRLRRIQVVGKPAGAPVHAALAKALGQVAFPRATGPYEQRFSLAVK